jgi:hypothetical protein
MNLMRHVVVFDAADVAAESSFGAGMLDGQVLADDTFHCVFDADEQCDTALLAYRDILAPDAPTPLRPEVREQWRAWLGNSTAHADR